MPSKSWGRRKILPCLSLSSSLLGEGGTWKWPFPADSRRDLGRLKETLTGLSNIQSKLKSQARGCWGEVQEASCTMAALVDPWACGVLHTWPGSQTSPRHAASALVTTELEKKIGNASQGINPHFTGLRNPCFSIIRNSSMFCEEGHCFSWLSVFIEYSPPSATSLLPLG